MLIKRPSDIKPSEIMPRGIYMRRRELLKSAGFLAAAGFAGVGSGPASALSRKTNGQLTMIQPIVPPMRIVPNWAAGSRRLAKAIALETDIDGT